ncbi:MAG TPA: hypothetical protein VHX37_00870 [Acidobacteriaceae bacterium]|jgi:hypothetical protein|nr:hypothetical protein [Acidobacteriaceae bacterium]
MSRRFAWMLMVVMMAGFLPRLWAQADQNDPLTPDEVQQIRDNRTNPNERIKLYIKFLDQRVDALKQLSAQPPGGDTWSAQVRDKLEEFTQLCDELQDNLDMYDSAHADIRKSLKDLKEDTAKWPPVLNGLPENRNYEFSQKTALEAAQSAADQTKQLAEEQDIFFTAHRSLKGKTGNGPS